MNRRAFLRLLVVGAVGAALPSPTVPLFVGECSARREGYTKIVITQRKLMARIRITAEAMEESRHTPPGSFIRYCRAEHARVMREAAEEFARHGIELT
jgi:hypothetical protein